MPFTLRFLEDRDILFVSEALGIQYTIAVKFKYHILTFKGWLLKYLVEKKQCACETSFSFHLEALYSFSQTLRVKASCITKYES